MNHIEKEKLIKADIASIENRVRHAFNQEYDLGFKDGKEKAKPLEQEPCEDATLKDIFCMGCEYKEPTTKNDLGVDCISRQSVIDELKSYFHDEYYQRTSIQDCRDCFIEDVLKHLPSVTPQLSSELEKNSKKLEKDFGELDCISRAEVLKLMQDNWHTHNGDWAMQESMDDIRALPSVTPQEPKTGHWIIYNYPGHECVYCSSCKEEYYEDDLYLGGSDFPKYCPNCGAKMVEPQESEVNNG